MIALVIKDQNGYDVEVFEEEAKAEERFYELAEGCDCEGDEVDWSFGSWKSDSGCEACYVANSVRLSNDFRNSLVVK